MTGFERSDLRIIFAGGLAQLRATPRIPSIGQRRFHREILMLDRRLLAGIPSLENPYCIATPAPRYPKQDCVVCARLWRAQSVPPAALAARRSRNALPSRTPSADCLAA